MSFDELITISAIALTIGCSFSYVLGMFITNKMWEVDCDRCNNTNCSNCLNTSDSGR